MNIVDCLVAENCYQPLSFTDTRTPKKAITQRLYDLVATKYFHSFRPGLLISAITLCIEKILLNGQELTTGEAQGGTG